MTRKSCRQQNLVNDCASVGVCALAMAATRTIIVASQHLAPVASLLEQRLPGVRVRVVTFENAIAGALIPDLQVTNSDIDQLKEADVLISDSFVIRQLMFRLPKLKWIQIGSAGVDPLTKAMTDEVTVAHGPPSVIVTRFSGNCYASFMFEYSFCFIVNYERGFLRQIPLKSSRSWSVLESHAPGNYRMVHELTITLLGIGSIGSRVAAKFRNHGTRVIGYGRRPRNDSELDQLGLDSYCTSLESALSSCDYVINILPHTPETVGLLDGVFSSCKKSPVFINLGRGSVVGTGYLLQSLDEGLISHAVLDVFDQEPLPASSLLWTHERVTITPHVSCKTRPELVADAFIENYHLFEANKSLNNVLDWEKLY